MLFQSSEQLKVPTNPGVVNQNDSPGNSNRKALVPDFNSISGMEIFGVRMQA